MLNNSYLGSIQTVQKGSEPEEPSNADNTLVSQKFLQVAKYWLSNARREKSSMALKPCPYSIYGKWKAILTLNMYSHDNKETSHLPPLMEEKTLTRETKSWIKGESTSRFCYSSVPWVLIFGCCFSFKSKRSWKEGLGRNQTFKTIDTWHLQLFSPGAVGGGEAGCFGAVCCGDLLGDSNFTNSIPENLFQSSPFKINCSY